MFEEHHFFDYEFCESVDQTDVMPISLGITNHDGSHELYIELQFDQERAEKHDFVREVVLPLLEEKPEDRLTLAQAREAIKAHFYQLPNVKLWAYFASRDFFLLTRAFGGLLLMPPGLPQRVMCLAQLHDHLNRDPRFKPKKSKTRQHHALVDARWDRDFGLNMFPHALAKGLGL